MKREKRTKPQLRCPDIWAAAYAAAIVEHVNVAASAGGLDCALKSVTTERAEYIADFAVEALEEWRTEGK